MTYHASAVDAQLLADGVMFDGSTINCSKDISESDMLPSPHCETAVMEPFAQKATVMLVM